ncbi:hypothetical protein HK098_005204 [Nowakowskiella sp. JEL0407]|nr:hypothetical protein HK098_005204 [Nowakowskiella sp. JEL0407]
MSSFPVAINQVPITIERKLPLDLDKQVANPGLPRANTIVNKEHPSYANSLLTGEPEDVLFSWYSQDSWIPNPLFPVNLNGIHRCKHGSDSESFDTEGRFVPEKFEEIFSKYDKGSKNALNFRELWDLTYGQRNVADVFGILAAIFEWGTLYLLCQENGLVSKEDIFGQYDGSLFYKVAARRKQNDTGRGYGGNINPVSTSDRPMLGTSVSGGRVGTVNTEGSLKVEPSKEKTV